MDRILVIGATGRIGREVVNHLCAENAAVRALSRQPKEANFSQEVEVVAGDLTNPLSLETTLAEVEAVFLLWTAPPQTAAEVIRRITDKTERLVFLSSPHQTPHPMFRQPNPMAVFHARLEQLINDAGIKASILRPGMFASNSLLWWAPQIKTGSKIVRWVYGTVETAPVSERDVGAVAARFLLDQKHIGGDYVLTGPESLSNEAQVRQIGEVLNRSLIFEEMTPDEFREMSLERGAPPQIVEMLLNAWQAAVGHPAYLTSTVADILGKPPQSFRHWVTEHAAEFR